MFSVNSETKQLALQPSRHIFVKALMGTKNGTTWDVDRTYTGSNYVSSVSVDIGSNSGGFQIGNAYCAKLTLRLLEGATVSQTDRIIIRVGFVKQDGTQSDNISLGWFYVDTIKKNGNMITVTAYDKMLRGQKNYKSNLTYPTTLAAVLQEVCDKMSVTLADDVLPFAYNPTVATKPIKGTDINGNKIYYTRREMLSYIASAVGGNFFFDVGGRLALTRYALVTDTYASENSIEADVSDDEFEVTDISWVTDGITTSKEDIDTYGVIEFENAIDFSDRAQTLAALKTKLEGISYHNAQIKRQGCGWFELGDIVTAYKKDGSSSNVLITGLNYTIQDGAYVEKVYSNALSDSKSNYTTGDVVGQTVPQSVASGTSGAYTSSIKFTPTGFELGFQSGGKAYKNIFTITENSAGQITKITNTTAGREIEVTYSD